MKQKNFEIGQKFYDLRKVKHHIINVFEHLEGRIVVYKFWSTRKQHWIYKVQEQWSLKISFDYGYKLIQKQ